MVNRNWTLWDADPTKRIEQLGTFIPIAYHARVPKDITVFEMTIASALLQESFTIGIGQGPLLRGADESTINCAICMDPLAGELTIRHIKPSQHTRIPDGCEHTWHFSCLLGWVAQAVKSHRQPQCPADRVPLLPKPIAGQICNAYMIREKPSHTIRYLHPDVVRQAINPQERAREDTTIRFWDHADDRVQNPSPCDFQLESADVENVLISASTGFDAGFVRPSIIRKLPLAPESRAIFERYIATEVPTDGFDGWGRAIYSPAYPYWGYVQLPDDNGGRVEHVSGNVRHQFAIFPLTQSMYRLLGRYLHGLAGDLLFIEMGGDGYPRPIIQTFPNVSIINLHAELTIRKWMQDDHDRNRHPRDQAWFYPFPNQVGGVHVAARLPPTNRFPGRGYLFREVNLGHTNDAAYARLASDPNHYAKSLYSHYLALYMLSEVPPNFPGGFELPGVSIPEQPGPIEPNAPRARSWRLGEAQYPRPENPDELFFGPRPVIEPSNIDPDIVRQTREPLVRVPQADNIASPIRPLDRIQPLFDPIPGEFDRFQNEARAQALEELRQEQLAEAEAARLRELERELERARAQRAADLARNEAEHQRRLEEIRVAAVRSQLRAYMIIHHLGESQPDKEISPGDLYKMFQYWPGPAPSQDTIDRLVNGYIQLVDLRSELQQRVDYARKRQDEVGLTEGVGALIDTCNAFEADIVICEQQLEEMLRGQRPVLLTYVHEVANGDENGNG